MDIFTDISLQDLKELATRDEKSFKQLAGKLKKVKKQEIDSFVHTWHAELFSDTDCLKCANCCRSLGPMLTDRDIDRLAKFLKKKPSAVVNQYLRQDKEGYYVFKNIPCPFLMADSYCMVYEARPKACREYPHTDKTNFKQIIQLSIKNSKTCPVVYKILKELMKTYG
ncbi:MAG: YkgJ family cysteine cluster protein [Bacteroidales bacterium]